MKDGFIKAAAGTIDVVVADVQYNTKQILARMREADAAGVNLLTLPELCLTGYTCGDLFFSDCLLGAVEPALARVVEASKDLYPVTAVGLPLRFGGKRYNCAAVVHAGRLLGVVPKTHLPNSMSCGSFPPRKRWREGRIRSRSAARACRLERSFCSAAPGCRTTPSVWSSARICGFPARRQRGSARAAQPSF